MEYKFLLNALTFKYKSTTFSTRDVYNLFMDYVRMTSGDTLFPLRNITMKRLSGDLDRLYRMGFLNRRKTIREIRQKSPMPSNRGFQYLYKVSKQGWQYSAYLQKDNAESQAVSSEARMRADMIDRIHQQYPPALAEFVESRVFPASYDYRGRHNRFPRKKYDEILRSLERCRDELRRKEAEIEWMKAILSRAGYQYKRQ